MAKVGKSSTSFDPFKKGRSDKTYEALSEAIGDLGSGGGGEAGAHEPREQTPDVEPPSPPTPRPEPPRSKESREARWPADPPEPLEQRAPAASKAPGSGQSRYSKRFQSTRAEAAEYDMSLVRLSSAVQTRVDFSKLTRVLWQVYRRHEDDILRAADGVQLPRKAQRGNAVDAAAFEEKLARVIHRGLMAASRRPQNLE